MQHDSVADARRLRAVRTGFERFLVVPGHEVRDIDDVVERHATHNVVSKQGVGRELAREADTRDGGGG